MFNEDPQPTKFLSAKDQQWMDKDGIAKIPTLELLLLTVSTVVVRF
jgi:hypothetical protein